MLMKKGEGLLALLDESTLSEKASDQHFSGELGVRLGKSKYTYVAQMPLLNTPSESMCL